MTDVGWDVLRARLLDLDAGRLAEMDAHGIEIAILSLNAPAIQAIPDAASACDVARRANDALAAAVARHPDRFAGFAALPMQDPEAATRELTRAVSDLGFKGALVNGFSQIGHDRVVYYDDPAYEAFWGAVEALGVPFYLHPRDPLPAREPIYDAHPWLRGPAWAFAAETAMHALRLITSGLFDRHPRAPHGRRIPAIERLPHDERKLPDLDADGGDLGNRRGPRPVFRGLSVRTDDRRGLLVRRRRARVGPAGCATRTNRR